MPLGDADRKSCDFGTRHGLLYAVRFVQTIPEHLREDRAREGVEQGEGLAAAAAQGVGRIQYPRNPPLLLEGREGDFSFVLTMFWLMFAALPPSATIYQ